MVYLLAGVMLWCLVYVIYLLGEYRPFVEAAELRILRVQDQIHRLERYLVEEEKRLAEVQGRVGELLNRHDDLQEKLRTSSQRLEGARLLETRLETEKNKQDYRRTRNSV